MDYRSGTLLIIDVQNDFLPDGTLAVEGSDEIIPVINMIQNQFEFIVATQDWHPSNHKSFASQHIDKLEYEVVKQNGLMQTLWPDHCVQGTDGAALSIKLSQNKIKTIFRKGTDVQVDSYSAFYDNDRKRSTGLSGYLKSLCVKDVYLCGLAGDYCVYYSALDALDEGFNVYIIEDAIRSISREGYEKAKSVLDSRGAVFLNSDVLINI